MHTLATSRASADHPVPMRMSRAIHRANAITSNKPTEAAPAVRPTMTLRVNAEQLRYRRKRARVRAAMRNLKPATKQIDGRLQAATRSTLQMHLKRRLRHFQPRSAALFAWVQSDPSTEIGEAAQAPPWRGMQPCPWHDCGLCSSETGPMISHRPVSPQRHSILSMHAALVTQMKRQRWHQRPHSKVTDYRTGGYCTQGSADTAG